MPTKEQVEKKLAETEQELAALRAQTAAQAAQSAAESPTDAFTKNVMMIIQSQQEAAKEERQAVQAQFQGQLRAQHEENLARLNTQREIADAQLKAQQQAAKEERDLLQGQFKAVMDELVDSKRRGPTASTPNRFKVSPPSQLTPEMSVAKLKAWRKAWQDYAEMCQLEKMTLREQQALFRSTLSLDMRDILEERIGIAEDQKPGAILDEIEKYIRKKRSVVLDIVEFDNRKQKTGESFDAYLVAIQQIAQDADLTCNHCPD